jgi:hypothetical protein
MISSMNENKFNILDFLTSIFSDWISRICFAIYVIMGIMKFYKVIKNPYPIFCNLFIFIGIACFITFIINLSYYIESTSSPENKQTIRQTIIIIISILYLLIIMSLLSKIGSYAFYDMPIPK